MKIGFLQIWKRVETFHEALDYSPGLIAQKTTVIKARVSQRCNSSNPRAGKHVCRYRVSGMWYSES